MKTLHQMTIKSTVSENYSAVITLVENVRNKHFKLLIHTTYKGKDSESTEIYDYYHIALKKYLSAVSKYAEHTAFMTL